VILRMHR